MMKSLYFIPLVFVLVLIACEYKEIEPNMSGKVDDFEFITQDNEKFSLKDLSGEWWIANFVYTNCTQVCPTMIPNMSIVQNKLQDLNLNAKIVSFSVDPNYDTPSVLRKYAEEYEVDLSTWTFLTDYEFSDIKRLSESSFKTSLDKGSPGETEFAHSTGFFLVDPHGKVIKRYDGMATQDIKLIIEDLKKVL